LVRFSSRYPKVKYELYSADLMMELLEKPDTPVKEIKLGYMILENESTNIL